MSRAFDYEASEYEYNPEMGEFGESEFGEGEEEFEGVQRFLTVAHTLASERRLSRFMYLALRPS